MKLNETTERNLINSVRSKLRFAQSLAEEHSDCALFAADVWFEPIAVGEPDQYQVRYRLPGSSKPHICTRTMQLDPDEYRFYKRMI